MTDTADSNNVINPIFARVPAFSTPSPPPTRPSHDPRLTKIMLELGLRYRPLALADQATFEATLAILTRDLTGVDPNLLAEAVRQWVRKSEFMPKAASLLSIMREMRPPPTDNDIQALCDRANANCTRPDLQWVVRHGDLKLEPR